MSCKEKVSFGSDVTRISHSAAISGAAKPLPGVCGRIVPPFFLALRRAASIA